PAFHEENGDYQESAQAHACEGRRLAETEAGESERLVDVKRRRPMAQGDFGEVRIVFHGEGDWVAPERGPEVVVDEGAGDEMCGFVGVARQFRLICLARPLHAQDGREENGE